MAYQATTATDWDDLLNKLGLFAATAGWTVVYNQTGQLAIEKGNCHIAIGTKSGENPVSRPGGYQDGIINAALSTSLNSGPPYQYWGHPGSLVTTEADGDRCVWNDINGDTQTNVWFFSAAAGEPDYIHCVVQCDGDRYTHFNFGNVDPVGMTHANVAFCFGLQWYWWNVLSQSNNMEYNQNRNPMVADDVGGHIYVPGSVLPVGYPAAGVYKVIDYKTGVMQMFNEEADYWTASPGFILDLFLPFHNQLVTGGTHLMGIPMFFQETTGGVSHCCLGVIPGVAVANIENHVPATELQYSGDTWMIFPWKRKGLLANLTGGADPQPECNTAYFAYAYKKNV